MGEVTKLRPSNPHVDLFIDALWELLGEEHFGSLNLAEVCGSFDFVKQDLIAGNWP